MFTHVRLPRSALLGALARPADARANLADIIQRVSVGTLALGAPALPVLQCCATLGALYGLRRRVRGDVPILAFPTQQAPILAAAADAYVLQAFQHWATEWFRVESDTRVRASIATVFKAVAVNHAQRAALAVSERCGAQGLFAHNVLCRLHVRFLWLRRDSYRQNLTLRA